MPCLHIFFTAEAFLPKMRVSVKNVPIDKTGETPYNIVNRLTMGRTGEIGYSGWNHPGGFGEREG